MTIVLGTCVIAVAAFCVWLVVWLINSRKKRGWKFWSAAALVMVVLYALSAAPAAFVEIKYGDPDWNATTPTRMVLRTVYAPISWLLKKSPEGIQRWHMAYAGWWSEILGGYEVEVEDGADGEQEVSEPPATP